jgi:electron transport complex protein RnfG
MSAALKTMLSAAALLGVFSVLGVGLVVLAHEATARRIAESERLALRHSVQSLVPAGAYDNDLLADAIAVREPSLGMDGPSRVYRARKAGQPVAAVLAPVAPDGYGGAIRLLVAVQADGRLAGVRVLAHRETPGLGDLIEEAKSGWILGFAGLSLDKPAERLWKVKRDGGAFDQFAGATVTPRAVVKAVKNTLRYFNAHRDALFAHEP